MTVMMVDRFLIVLIKFTLWMILKIRRKKPTMLKTIFKYSKDNNDKGEMFSKRLNIVVTTFRSIKNLIHVAYTFFTEYQ